MPAKKSRSNPKGDQESQNYTTAEVLIDKATGEEIAFGGAIVNSDVLAGFGREVKASLSRSNPEGYTSPDSRKETSDYFHIFNAANPFNSDKCGVGSYESIELAQKAFYSFPAFRNPILMQAYLSNSPIHWTAKNNKVSLFFEEWAKKCSLWNLANEFFLEWFRSGNVFIYKFEGEIKLNEVKKLAKGAKEAIAKNRKLPLKYILLNPRDVRGLGSSVFADQSYGKVLNSYEIDRLLDPDTEEDKAIYEGLSKDAKKAIKDRQSPIITLDPKRLRIAFNAKQSYEPMAIPPYFGVLRSINFKQILRSAEEKVAASADYCILFITAGEKEKKESENRKLIEAMANLFSAQSVGRVLFAHYSAKADFVIPDLNKIFGSEKYTDVNKDIIDGMNDIMASDENFATGQTKTKIYLQLLSQARESFLNFFLKPEVDRICEEMGFAESPVPRFEEVSLESLNEAKKLYNRLYELGAITPKELFDAYETNMLPLYENSIENQKEFKGQKKTDIYKPLIGGDKEAGRPTGTGTPKTKNKISPKGQASLERIKEIYPKMSGLAELVQGLYKKKNSIARLSKKNKEFTDKIWETVIASSGPENWDSTAAKLVENPMSADFEGEQYGEIQDLAEEHQIGILEASILFHSLENK